MRTLKNIGSKKTYQFTQSTGMFIKIYFLNQLQRWDGEFIVVDFSEKVSHRNNVTRNWLGLDSFCVGWNREKFAAYNDDTDLVPEQYKEVISPANTLLGQQREIRLNKDVSADFQNIKAVRTAIEEGDLLVISADRDGIVIEQIEESELDNLVVNNELSPEQVDVIQDIKRLRGIVSEDVEYNLNGEQKVV
jgi:hypothetical protein